MAHVTFIPKHDRSENADFQGAVLLVASVTIGNVPQMGVDLLLGSCGAKHEGAMRAPALLPLAGYDESNTLITAAELYSLRTLPESGRRVYVLQHRAPPSRGRAAEHARAVTAWAASAGFAELVVLCSANAAGRRDAQLRTAGVQTVRGEHNPELALVAAAAEAAGASPLPGCDTNGVWKDTNDVPAFVPLRREASFVRNVVDATARNKIPCSVLLTFAHEGDNAFDALAFAASVANAAKLHVQGAPEQPSVETLIRCFVPPNAWAALAPPPPGLY